MNKTLSEIVLVMDRSGSMASIKEEAEGGINHFLDEQKRLPGEANFTLVQFDTEYEIPFRGVPIRNVPEIKLEPRGETALLDALGRAIVETGDRLSKTPEWNRPGVVAIVVITDGHENASHEFTKAKIKEMVEHQQNVYKWKFSFLAADLGAFDDGAGMGIAVGGTSPYFGGVALAWGLKAASDHVGKMRSASNIGEAVPDFSYTDEEREKMAGSDKNQPKP
jgi:uncharacterized protein YegL